MGDIVFARPRYEYQSYVDVWRVITLSGFPLVFIDQVDWSKDQTVILPVKNGEWASIPDRHAARVIWYTFERFSNDSDPLDMANPFVPPCVDELWCHDRAMARRVNGRYVFLGGHEQFGAVSVVNREQYDLICLMYWSPRRLPLRDRLLRGFSVADPDGSCWGFEREKKLNASRLMINAHQDNQGWSEPIKWMVAGCYGVPLLSEPCTDSGHWIPNYHYHVAPFDDLTAVAKALLVERVALRRYAAHAYRLVVRERPFAKEVHEAVEGVTA